MFDARVDYARVAAEDVDADATHGPVGEAFGEVSPRPSGISGFPEAAVRPTAIHAPARAPTLIGGRVQRLVIGRIHHECCAARIGSGVEDACPRHTAIGTLVDAALTARLPQIAEGCDVYDIVIDRVNDDARDLF